MNAHLFLKLALTNVYWEHQSRPLPRPHLPPQKLSGRPYKNTPIFENEVIGVIIYGF